MEAGIGSHELGYLYGVLIDHISDKMLSNKTVGSADLNDLKFAFYHLKNVEENIIKRPGLVDSIIKYKENKNANK